MSDIKYKYVIDNDNERRECISCKRYVPVYPFRTEKSNKPEHKYQLFCEICSTTFVSNHHSNQRELHDITQIIAAVGNIIRNDLGVFKEADSVCFGDYNKYNEFINDPFKEAHWFEE